MLLPPRRARARARSQPDAAVRVLHACIDCNNWRQAKGSRRRLHKALQLTLLQLSRAATAVATIGIGLISMDSMPLSAQPTGSTGRAVYLVR